MILNRLSERSKGARLLAKCDGQMYWPECGIYFFQETDELRANGKPRIARIGTHRITQTSRTKLWDRLRQHRGVLSTGRGNHRGSIFRGLVGFALMQRHGLNCPTWLKKDAISIANQKGELELECLVSQYIGNKMPLLWLAVPKLEQRKFIERHAIALLSGYDNRDADSPSASWLGHDSNKEKARRSGLWNQQYINEDYDPAFLEQLECLCEAEY